MDVRKTQKKWKRRNLALNAGLCLGSVAVFGFNPIAICACYIGSDIVLSLVNEAIKRNVIKHNLDGEEAKDFKRQLTDYYQFHTKGSQHKEVEQMLIKLTQEQDKFIEAKKEMERQQEEEKRMVLMRRVKGLEDVYEIIDRFLEFYDSIEENLTDMKLKKLEKIRDEFIKLKENLEKKPEACFLVNGSFSTYTNELMLLISDYPNVSPEMRSEYNEKYKELLKEFLTFLEEMNQSIEKSSMVDMELGLETLISELKKQIQKIKSDPA